jgi:hypothetical protein
VETVEASEPVVHASPEEAVAAVAAVAAKKRKEQGKERRWERDRVLEGLRVASQGKAAAAASRAAERWQAAAAERAREKQAASAAAVGAVVSQHVDADGSSGGDGDAKGAFDAHQLLELGMAAGGLRRGVFHESFGLASHEQVRVMKRDDGMAGPRRDPSMALVFDRSTGGATKPRAVRSFSHTPSYSIRDSPYRKISLFVVLLTVFR